MRNGNEPERFLFLFPDFMDRIRATGLTANERWEWLVVLLSQLRYGYTYSTFHPTAEYSRRRIRRFVELGLLEERDGHLHIADWEGWNGRREYKRLLNRERQQRFRDRKKVSRETT